MSNQVDTETLILFWQFAINSLEEFDRILIDLDNTNDKSYLGANTLLSLSMSFSKSIDKFNDSSIPEIGNFIIIPAYIFRILPNINLLNL